MPDIDDDSGWATAWARMKAATPGLHVYPPECNLGWFPLIERMYSRIEAVTTRIGFNQVKEKFGQLRVYYHLDADLPEDEYDRLSAEIDAIVKDAEREAEATCEWCGKPGRIREYDGWYITLCDRHAEEHSQNRKGLR